MSKQELADYYQSGNHVFHGSITPDLDVLEPRQAVSFGNPDGKPAIFATPEIEPAIFMAILGSRKVAGWDSENFGGRFGFHIGKTDWKQAKRENWRGYVYVLDANQFQKGKSWVWKSEKPARVLKVIGVGIEDLPSEIHVLSDGDEENYVKRYTDKSAPSS